MKGESGCFPNFNPQPPPCIFFHQTIFLITQQKLQQPDFKEHQKFSRETNITLNSGWGQNKWGCATIKMNTQRCHALWALCLDLCPFVWLLLWLYFIFAKIFQVLTFLVFYLTRFSLYLKGVYFALLCLITFVYFLHFIVHCSKFFNCIYFWHSFLL